MKTTTDKKPMTRAQSLLGAFLLAWTAGAAGATIVLAPSCAMLGARADVVEMTPAFQRSVQRVADRVEAYLAAEPGLEGLAEARMALSDALELVYGAPEHHVWTLHPVLEPLMTLHDGLVEADESLLPDEKDVYLGTTERLRGVLARALEAAS